MKEILSRGIEKDGETLAVEIKAIICDAPARSFVKGCVGHGHVAGCERCSQKGFYNVDRMTFPRVIVPPGMLRTNELFRSMDDESHHKYISPMVDIDDLDLIFDFPLDPMHLVYLGVVKRYLGILFVGDKRNKSIHRLKNQHGNL